MVIGVNCGVVQVLIELGNAEGFSTISHAREYLLDLTSDDDGDGIRVI